MKNMQSITNTQLFLKYLLLLGRIASKLAQLSITMTWFEAITAYLISIFINPGMPVEISWCSSHQVAR